MVGIMKAYNRCLKIKLECGHTVNESTSFYKLNRNRVSVLLGHFQAKGIFCFKCHAICQPTDYLGTCRSN